MKYREVVYLIKTKVNFTYKKRLSKSYVFGRFLGTWIDLKLWIYRDLQKWNGKKYNFVYTNNNMEDVFGNYNNIRDLRNLIKLIKKEIR